MGKRGKPSESSASDREKRVKAEVSPEVNAEPNPYTVKWSDLHYDLVRDIFCHLPSTEQARYRRVCSGWNCLLVEQLSLSSVINLQYRDLKMWKAIFCSPVRETRGTTKEMRVKLVTDRTRTLIIDFGNIELQLEWDSRRKVFGFDRDGPAVFVTQNHPQINRIVVQRARLCVPSGHSAVHRGPLEQQFLDFLGVGSYLAKGVSVAILKCATIHKASITKKWTTRMESEDIEKWTLLWPNMTLTDPKSVPEKTYQCYKILSRYYSTYWPYRTKQLEWLEACLGKLPTKDRLSSYLEKNKFYTNHPLEKLCCVKVLGATYLKSTAAFCARYLTTFRTVLNLPQPP